MQGVEWWFLTSESDPSEMKIAWRIACKVSITPRHWSSAQEVKWTSQVPVKWQTSHCQMPSEMPTLDSPSHQGLVMAPLFLAIWMQRMEKVELQMVLMWQGVRNPVSERLSDASEPVGLNQWHIYLSRMIWQDWSCKCNSFLARISS